MLLSISFSVLFACLTSDRLPVTVYPEAIVGIDGAYTDCPCQLFNESFDGVNLRADYGSFCSDWDSHGLGWPACKTADQPRYCMQRWCYIDPTNCSRPNKKSSNPVDVYFSYETCGSLDLIAEYLMVEPSRKLYNGMLPFANGLGKWQPLDTPRSYRAVVGYARLLLEEMGVDVSEVRQRNISNTSKTAVESLGSPYTACAIDIALGSLDFCLYDFWQTSSRINLGIVPVAVSADRFYFWTRKTLSKPQDFWQMLEAPCAPFSAGLWLLIVAVLLLMAFIHSGLEHGFCAAFCKPYHFLEALRLSLTSLFGGAIESTKYKKLSSQVLSVGFAAFIVVCISAFTANTASFLIQEGLDTPGIGFDHALRKCHKICYFDIIREELLQKYPDMHNCGVEVKWTKENILRQVEDHVCDHAVGSYIDTSPTEWSCSFVAQGSPVLSVPIGPFVAKEFGLHFLVFNAALQKRIDWEAKWFEPYACPKRLHAEGKEALQLQPEHMLGNCFMMVACTLVALLLHIIDARVDVVGGKIKWNDPRRHLGKRTSTTIGLSEVAAPANEIIKTPSTNSEMFRVIQRACDSFGISSIVGADRNHEIDARISNVVEWPPEWVSAWLRDVGFPNEARKFYREGIDGDVLLTLEAPALMSILDVRTLGERTKRCKRLMRQIQLLRDSSKAMSELPETTDEKLETTGGRDEDSCRCLSI